MLVDPLKILRKRSWITIINLAVADLVVCFNMLFRRIRRCVGAKELLTTEYFFVMNFLLCLGIAASFMLLAFLSLQVYTVTKFPLKAPHFWKRKRVVFCCVGIWLLASLLGLAKIFMYRHLNFDIYFKLAIVRLVVWSIIIIIQIGLRILTCREIFKNRRNSGPSPSFKHRQLTITVMIMVAIQMFTIFPSIVIKQLRLILFSLSFDLLRKIDTYHAPLALLNFCVNPIIYFLRLPDFRSSLLSLCGCQTPSEIQRNERNELPSLPCTAPQPPS